MNVNLELTDHCNIACGMCSQSMRDEAHDGPKRFMDFETWRRSLLGLRGLPDVALCPHWLGEPTLHPRFDAFVEYAFAINGRNSIFRTFKLHTNAVILPAERARLLARLARASDQAPDTFQAIHLSIDALSPAVYARVKGKDRGDLVTRNVDRLLELRGAQTWPVAHVSFVVQEHNRHEARAFVERWGKRLDALGRPWRLTSDWPGFDRDAIYLRRLNAGDQARADAWHAEACRAVGLPVSGRSEGSF